jgi:hypothetical protein
MANYEATRYDFTGANLTGIEGIPTATIVPWSTASVPTGFLECNGQAVSQATYSALYAIIGITYGDPGGGNFNVPNLQDNVPLGKSPTKNRCFIRWSKYSYINRKRWWSNSKCNFIRSPISTTSTPWWRKCFWAITQYTWRTFPFFTSCNWSNWIR